MNMKKLLLSKLLLSSIALTALLSAQVSSAIDIVASNSEYYYKLGGGSDINIPPVTDNETITVGGDINTNLGFSCAGFNPAIAIANSFKNIKNSVEGLGHNIVYSATNAIGTLPMYLLEKASPELYNLLQNTITNAKDTFNISMKDCQTALNQIQSGKSPYQNWFSVSDSQGWLNSERRVKQGQKVDINAVAKQQLKNPYQYGVPWVHKGQNSGGIIGNEKPIKVIYDVVVAGYNVMVNPARPLDSIMSAPPTSSLYRYWKTPKDAGLWARMVLGDITISSKSTMPTYPGVGLVTVLRTCPNSSQRSLTCAKTLYEKLSTLVNNPGTPSATDLAAVSSGEMLITPQVIYALRNLTAQERLITLSKISEDVAIQNLIDEALLMRRILLASTQIKAIQNLNPALKKIHTAVQTLDTDVQNLLFENRIRKQMMGNTLQTLLNLSGNQQLSAASSATTTQRPNLNHGAIYKNTGGNSL